MLQIPYLLSFKNLKHAIFLKPLDFSEKKEKQNLPHVTQTLERSVVIFPRQLHGKDLYHVKTPLPTIPPEADILVTQEKGICLGIRHADCQAAIFFDPCTSTLAMVHCGWKGHILQVYLHCIQYLKTLGVKPENLHVGISPSLGPEKAEFIHYKKEFPPSFWRFKDQKHRFDLWKLAIEQLKEAGIPEQHIALYGQCTHSHPHLYHSYRYNKTSQRMASVACLI